MFVINLLCDKNVCSHCEQYRFIITLNYNNMMTVLRIKFLMSFIPDEIKLSFAKIRFPNVLNPKHLSHQ